MSLESREKEITELKTPIDAMYLIHKALRAEAKEAEGMVYEMDMGESLQSFRAIFNEWASVLVFHALIEDEFMTAFLSDLPQTRVNEESHRRLEQRLEEVEACMDEEIGRAHVMARTQRHLYGRVVRLQIAQDDHLEEEEEFVLPLIREQLDENQQKMIVTRLLLDDEGQNKHWILDWLSRHLTPKECSLLKAVASS